MLRNRSSSVGGADYFTRCAEVATNMGIDNPYPLHCPIDYRLYHIIDAQRSPEQMEKVLVEYPFLLEAKIFNGPVPYLQNLTSEPIDPAVPYEQTRLVSGLLLEEQLRNISVLEESQDRPTTCPGHIKAIDTKYILAATETLCSVQDVFNETDTERNPELPNSARRDLFHTIQEQIANFWQHFPRSEQPTLTDTILDMHTHIVTHDLALFSNEPSDPAENIQAKISAIKGLQAVEKAIECIMKRPQSNGVFEKLCSFRGYVRYFYDLYAKEIGFDLESDRLAQPVTKLGKTAVATAIDPPQITTAA